MILKLVACAAIIGGCGCMGIMLGTRCKKRTQQLGEFRSALKQLEFDVDFLNITLCESFGKIASNSSEGVRSVFSYIMKRLSENRCIDMESCWAKAFKIYSNELYINDDDKKIIEDFAKNLGSGDRENEMNNIKAADMRLKIAEEDSHTEGEKNSKMYRGLGFLCGIFLVIILI